MRIVSWNVNGLRAVAKKGFLDWLNQEKADLVGLQETRVTEAQLEDALRKPEGFHTHFSAAEKLGYSGVGIYSRRPWDEISTSLGSPDFDREGRLQFVRFGRLLVVNGYFPNGSGKEGDNSRVPYKMNFYARLFDRVNDARKDGLRVVVMGDLNTAHNEIDLARPKANAKLSGFLREERDELDRWIAGGFHDSFRVFESGAEHYSWWSARFGMREKNVGWRLDYALTCPEAKQFLRAAAIHKDVMGSDHCPISLELDDAVLV